MTKLASFAVYALMAPAITLGIGSAFATEPPAGTTGAKDQRTSQESRSTQGQPQMPSQAQKDTGMGMGTTDRAQEQHTAAERAKQNMKNHGQNMKAHGTYLSSAPANSLRSDDLIGAELMSRSDDETIGEISDLVIDEEGHIVAVIVEAGGFLGLGEKDVAVSWDAIERRSNDDDGYEFSVDTTKDALTDAPAYKSLERKTDTLDRKTDSLDRKTDSVDRKSDDAKKY